MRKGTGRKGWKMVGIATEGARGGRHDGMEGEQGGSERKREGKKE